jgi:hypothetical protein
MFTIFWSLLGFPVVDQLATGAKMDSEYFTTNVLAQLERSMFPDGRRPHAKRMTVHLDDCSVHTTGASEVYRAEHTMIRLKHPPDLPDLASSDFYLFPTVKEPVKDIEMIEEEHLFNRLKEILNEIPHKELDKIVGAWINRLTRASEGDGGYISERITLDMGGWSFVHRIRAPQRQLDETMPLFGLARFIFQSDLGQPPCNSRSVTLAQQNQRPDAQRKVSNWCQRRHEQVDGVEDPTDCEGSICCLR